MTSALSIHTRTPSSLRVRSVYSPGARSTLPVASSAKNSRGTSARGARYPSKSRRGAFKDRIGVAVLNAAGDAGSFRRLRVLSLHLKNRTLQSIGSSKREYEKRYGLPAVRRSPRGETVAEPTYSSVRSQSPTESGLGVTRMV